jgi:hypothetical protein
MSLSAVDGLINCKTWQLHYALTLGIAKTVGEVNSTGEPDITTVFLSGIH